MKRWKIEDKAEKMIINKWFKAFYSVIFQNQNQIEIRLKSLLQTKLEHDQKKISRNERLDVNQKVQ